MTLQRKNTQLSLDLLDKDDILEFQLPKWNSPNSFRNAWNTILIHVQGSQSLLENTTLEERNRLYQTLRQLRKSYYSYPLATHTSVLITSYHKPLIRIHLSNQHFRQNWAQLDIKDENNINSFDCNRIINHCFYGGLFISLCIWSLIFHTA